MEKYDDIINFIKTIYNNESFIPLHAPIFNGNEKKYLCDCIDSTFVSSVGKYVDLFEEMVEQYTGAEKAVAVVNGTAALHTALNLLGVKQNDEVITQSLTFIATCNAISYCGANPVFIDVDYDTLGMSPDSLKKYFEENCKYEKGNVINKITGKRVSACIPMHTFGHPVRIKEIIDICNEWNIPVIEDAAESIGSFVGNKHTGLFGKCGILSFNGNKTITTGGGGMIITNDKNFGKLAKHITTTAKIPHKWEFKHDMIGFNYRMPNINAALGCAQIEQLPEYIKIKRNTAERYKNYFKNTQYEFFSERPGTISNYWLNAVIFNSEKEKTDFLEFSNNSGVMTRPVWTLMNQLEIYRKSFKVKLDNSEKIEKLIVNLPSSVLLG